MGSYNIASTPGPRTNRPRTFERAGFRHLDARLADGLLRLDGGDGHLVRALVADAQGLVVASTERDARDEETAALAAIVTSFLPRFAGAHGAVAHVTLHLEGRRLIEIHPLGDGGSHIVVLTTAALDPLRVSRVARELRNLLGDAP